MPWEWEECVPFICHTGFEDAEILMGRHSKYEVNEVFNLSLLLTLQVAALLLHVAWI